MTNDIVRYEARSGGEVVLSPQIIKQTLCPDATQQEILMFLQLCKYQQLNPFLREVYLIKFKGFPATTIVGKETFTKRADGHPQFDGFKAGIIVLDIGGKIVHREGSCVFEKETLLGGWASVFRKDRKMPFYAEVSLKEYEQHTKDGKLTKLWDTKSATMIRKVPLVQALREAFPTLFGGLNDAAEMPVGDKDLSPEPIMAIAGKSQPEPPSEASQVSIPANPDLQTVLDRLAECKAIPELKNVWAKYVTTTTGWNTEDFSVLEQAYGQQKTAITKKLKDAATRTPEGNGLDDGGEFPGEEIETVASPEEIEVTITKLKDTTWKKIQQLEMGTAAMNDLCMDISDQAAKSPTYMGEAHLTQLNIYLDEELDKRLAVKSPR